MYVASKKLKNYLFCHFGTGASLAASEAWLKVTDCTLCFMVICLLSIQGSGG